MFLVLTSLTPNAGAESPSRPFTPLVGPENITRSGRNSAIVFPICGFGSSYPGKPKTMRPCPWRKSYKAVANRQSLPFDNCNHRIPHRQMDGSRFSEGVLVTPPLRRLDDASEQGSHAFFAASNHVLPHIS